jgi:predicted DNA binding CopG/RHH family protein
MTDHLDSVEDIRLKRLANLLGDVAPAELNTLLRKDSAIQMRVTEADKDDIKGTAKNLGLTVTEYLLRCHYIVSKRLSEES